MQLRGIVGLFPAASTDDDIEVSLDGGAHATLFTLRQQQEKDTKVREWWNIRARIDECIFAYLNVCA